MLGKVRGQSPHRWESHNKSYSKLHHASVHLHFVTSLSFIEKLFFATWLQKPKKKESCVETLNVCLPQFSTTFGKVFKNITQRLVHFLFSYFSTKNNFLIYSPLYPFFSYCHLSFVWSGYGTFSTRNLI
jgi:hypothetical protein